MVALVALALGSCASSKDYASLAKTYKLPPIPSHIQKCVSVVNIPKTLRSERDVKLFIARLRTSELGKRRCVQQAIRFYESVRRNAEGV